MTVQYTILHSMSLNCECMLTNTYDVLGELESTWSQIREMEYEYMDGVFFQLWWKEQPAEKVTWKMYKIHGTPCVQLGLLNDWLLCDNWGVASASSQLQRPCLEYVMKENLSPVLRSWLKL